MSTDATRDFFDRRDEQNHLKSLIVTDFFKAYAAIILRTESRVRYVDLFAGRGYYDGCNYLHVGTPVDATPLMIAKAVIANSRFRAAVATWFNEGESALFEQLVTACKSTPGFANLAIQPRFTNLDVNSPDFAREVTKITDCPIFAFVDPFGYKGITRELIGSLINGWGCDVAFFFNYRRVNVGIGHNLFDEHFEKLVGEERLQQLHQNVVGLDPEEREERVVAALRESLRELKAKHVLTFRFRIADGRTSHHLVFASKHERGYLSMREKMIQHSAKGGEDIAYFEFVAGNPDKPTLFETPIVMPPRNWPHGVRELATALYEKHRNDTKPVLFARLLRTWLLREDLPYAEKHYRQALTILSDERKAEVIASDRTKPIRRGTVPQNASIRFL